MPKSMKRKRKSAKSSSKPLQALSSRRPSQLRRSPRLALLHMAARTQTYSGLGDRAMGKDGQAKKGIKRPNSHLEDDSPRPTKKEKLELELPHPKASGPAHALQAPSTPAKLGTGRRLVAPKPPTRPSNTRSNPLPPPLGIKQKKSNGSHIQRFFSQYPLFRYNPKKETMQQFWDLSKRYGWTVEVRNKNLDKIREVIAEVFNRFYGDSVGSLTSWQMLCHVCKVDPLPGTVEECQKIMSTIHVNICDLVDFKLTGKHPPLFPTEDKLAEYSRMNGKIYPKKQAKEKTLLRCLLRHIFEG